MMDGMLDVLLTSTALKIGHATLAAFTLLLFIRLMEWAFDVSTKEAWSKINDNSIAVALFMGCIVIAGAHLIGLLWS